MRLSITARIFQCGKRTCRKAISIRAGSFFSKSKLPCSQILFLGYLWLSKSPVSSIISISGKDSHTVCSFQKYFRQLVSDSIEVEDVVIGGEGVEVEIDESKLGKRKYNRGHRVEGVWVVGGVERTSERKVFLVEVISRNKETLLEIIKRHVLPGSIIYTDLWKGYSGLENEGYEHFSVNHSIQFKVPGTNIHTNSIEGTWNGLKLQIRPRNRTKEVEDHLWEFIWRRRNENGLWNAFINALKDIHYS